MKNVGVYRYDKNIFSELEEILKQENIIFIPLDDDITREDIELYIFNVDSQKEFDNIIFNSPFLIISSLNSSSNLLKSKKIGAIDYILKPFVDIMVISKRIERSLKKNNDSSVKSNVLRTSNNDKLIDIELKRAHRGKYPLSLLLVKILKNISDEELIKLIDKMKVSLRDSDSCLIYPDQDLIVMLPFADRDGTIVVVRKVYNLLSDLSYKNYCLASIYPEEGDSREELVSNLGKTIDSRNLYK